MEVIILSDILKYICIVLCFSVSLFIGKNKINKKDVILLQFGLFITVLADLFFLILYNNVLGVATFCVVQILYSIRYDIDKAKLTIRNFIVIFVIVAFSYVVVNAYIIEIHIILFIGLYYSICLITSAWKAIKACNNKVFPYPNNYMIASGMILFLLCDINVFIYNVLGFLYSQRLIWLFYIPSQILLSLSRYKNLSRKIQLWILIGQASID